MKYLPSKKITIIIIFVIIISGAVFWVTEKGKERQGVQDILIENVRNSKLIAEIADKDSDGDNLADWEEALWATDPENPDSDGDGTLDGEEILTNRNPLVAGPDDFLQTTVVGEEVVSDDGLTLSGQFGKDFFIGYASLRGSGSTREVSPEIFYKTITDNVAKIEPVENYKVSDLRTTDNSLTSIRNYGNSLGRNFKLGISNEENELAVIVAILEGKKDENVEKLKEIAGKHREILELNLLVSVPSEVKVLHLAMLNSYNRFINSLENLSKVLVDPLIGIVGLGQYSQETEVFTKMVVDLKEYFVLKNVVFNRSEDGYMFSQ
jgi:hypothetical protein